MPRHQIAPRKEHEDVILVALVEAFGQKPEAQKERALIELQLRCRIGNVRCAAVRYGIRSMRMALECPNIVSVAAEWIRR
jgi:hypothetical protein